MKSVLILGSGGLRIGQAGEFDYSGTQAIKALKEEGLKTILVNPNIATVQTDPSMADVVYLQPLDVTTVEKIIEKERPSAILLSFGGQTALNLGLSLEEKGILKKYKVKVLGTPVETIRLTEDRDLFKQNLNSIGVLSPQSIAAETVDEAVHAARKIGYPVMMRSGFSLGGLGSGKVVDEAELKGKARQALQGAPQVLIEEYLLGWKELEYEVVRDCHDQALVICNMENLDPMGIHTGESIVVAPSQTLNNDEYHTLREISLKCARHFQIQGECNVQFALDPKTGQYRVIEMNARLSRSSALASKATGYPLAFVAAKLALGFRLDEVPNAITKKTTAFFEPALDYIVVKCPRWDTQKLKSADRTIGTEMKSVGEVMAIGRNFPEAMQKAVRMLNIGSSGIDQPPEEMQSLINEIKKPTDLRLFALYQFFQKGGSVLDAQDLSLIDPWFLNQLKELSDFQQTLEGRKTTPAQIRKAKELGFSDKSIAKIKKMQESAIRKYRHKHKITPFIKQIDTMAGEFDAETNYLYTTYSATCHDVTPSKKKPIVVLGSGPYCIGSSVEFDWCAVNMARTLRELGAEVVMINSNPETVSTDFDESDRLYFEELTLERVQDIADFESPKGIVVSVGGQIANNLAMPLHKEKYPILGTSAPYIDMAENRDTFSSLLHQLNIDQPPWEKVTSLKKAKDFAEQHGYPVLIRPSYVLSGAAMNVVANEEEMEKYLLEAAILSPDHPTVISKFIEHAKELEIDGVAKHGEVIVSAISEHVENAGVHSGDATIVLPPQRLYLETIRRSKKITREIVKALKITGPFNIQFIAKGNAIQVIECNVRASRSFPFVSKVTGHNFIEIIAEILLGKYKPRNYETLELDYVGVKTPQFSYKRLKGADPVANVEMASTGEVAHIGDNYLEAFFASWLSTEQKILGKKVLISAPADYRIKLLESLRELESQGWDLYATEGTHDFLSKHGVGSVSLYKVGEKYEPNIATMLANRNIDLIINIPRSGVEKNSAGFKIRRLAIDHHIPLITNLQLAQIFLQCLAELELENLPVRSLQEMTKI
ncbi:MAG: carbamoyl phosphate synthase large subunit [Chlamydiae bacterium CG10_big_fil_rev_8_21_14_0_10_42_34]|nr:MAG: carbamoyl phosphate synthase large subunit [Chlamydiae bacterium CG10_big_fil_rev_8_21_14_0_10_42_34]